MVSAKRRPWWKMTRWSHNSSSSSSSVRLHVWLNPNAPAIWPRMINRTSLSSVTASSCALILNPQQGLRARRTLDCPVDKLTQSAAAGRGCPQPAVTVSTGREGGGGPLRTYWTHICDRLAQSMTDTDKLPLSMWGIIREMETVLQSACGGRTRSFSNLFAVAPVVSGGLHTNCLACILTRSAPLGVEHYLNETAGCW